MVKELKRKVGIVVEDAPSVKDKRNLIEILINTVGTQDIIRKAVTKSRIQFSALEGAYRIGR